MLKLTGLALTLTAAGVFALAQSGSQSTAGRQTDRPGSQSSTGSSQSQSGQQMDSADRTFLTKAAQGSMAEVALGKLAQERGSSDQVKELGKQLEQDHQKAFEEIQRIASSKSLALPQTPDQKHQQAHDRLSKLSGDQFDRAFLKEVHREHNRDIKEFQKQSERAKDNEVRQFASSTLDTLRKHHDLAQQAMSASGSGRSSGIRTDEPGTTERREKQGERKP